MKKLFPILACLVVFASCGDITAEVERYEDEENGFALDLPQGWDISQKYKDNDFIKVIAESPSQGVLDDFHENINVGIEVKGDMDFDDYIALSIENMDGLEEFKLLDEGSWDEVDLTNGFIFYEHSYEGIRIRAMATVYEYDGRAYIVTCTAKQDSYADYESIFEKVFLSFELI
jgi:hypothetical protein